MDRSCARPLSRKALGGEVLVEPRLLGGRTFEVAAEDQRPPIAPFNRGLLRRRSPSCARAVPAFARGVRLADAHARRSLVQSAATFHPPSLRQPVRASCDAPPEHVSRAPAQPLVEPPSPRLDQSDGGRRSTRSALRADWREVFSRRPCSPDLNPELLEPARRRLSWISATIPVRKKKKKNRVQRAATPGGRDCLVVDLDRQSAPVEEVPCQARTTMPW